MYRLVQTSSIDQNAETPAELMQLIMQTFQLTWDPCPPNYTVDGLTRQWVPGAFVNPPFKESKQWLHKAQSEKTYAVFLLPLVKLHCQFMETIWSSIDGISLLPRLIKFKNYKKPLNKAMTLLSMNCPVVPITPITCYAYCWLGLVNRTMAGLVEELKGHDVTIVQDHPSQSLPYLLQKKQFIIIMPSRLDLLVLRKNLHVLSEIFFCPTVKAHHADKDNLWIPPIVITKGIQIASQLRGLHEHKIPVRILQW